MIAWHILCVLIWLCVRFTECSIEFTSFNICARWIVFMRWIGFMLFSVLRKEKKKRHQQTTQPIYIHIWCDYMHIEGFVCTFFRESNPHKSIGRTKQHNTPHTTHSRRQNDKVFFVCWLCGRCGIIFHLRVENMLKTASKTKVKV